MLNKFVLPNSTTVENDELYGGVNYIHEINADEDLTVGTAACASIEFVTTSTSFYTQQEIKYYRQQQGDSSYGLVDVFYVHSVEQVKDISRGIRYKVTAYDAISKFDKVVDDWLDGLTFPMTLLDFLKSLCNYCGCYYYGTSFVNSTQQIQDNFTGTNITGRQILSYIAQMAAGYISSYTGNVIVGYYNTRSKSLNRTNYISCVRTTYTCNKIDKVWVGMEDGDTGVTSGTGTNELRITYNPLFFADSTSEIQTAVDNVYYKVNSYVVYRPMEVTLFKDYGIDVGDIIQVDGYYTYVMSKKVTESGVVLSSTGNKTRTQGTTSEETSITALRGKYNILKRDLESTESEVGDLQVGFTKITQTATAIESIVSGTAEYVESATEPETKTTGMVWYNTTTEEYKQWDGTQWLDVDESVKGAAVTNTITQTLDGVVFTGTSGDTVINGSNITTGTIQADRLNLTGSISFGDCDSELQTKINSSGEIYRSTTIPSTTTEGALWYCMQSQGTYVAGKWYTYEGGTWVLNETELPSYLKSTYIDSTSIYSPTIIGAEIYAGATSDGYVVMNDTGLELHTDQSASTPLIDIGYEEDTYEYPYILLGRGGTGGINKGMVKKFTDGIWIGNNTDQSSTSISSGTGLFVDSTNGKIYKVINGSMSELGSAVFG